MTRVQKHLVGMTGGEAAHTRNTRSQNRIVFFETREQVDGDRRENSLKFATWKSLLQAYQAIKSVQ